MKDLSPRNRTIVHCLAGVVVVGAPWVISPLGGAAVWTSAALSAAGATAVALTWRAPWWQGHAGQTATIPATAAGPRRMWRRSAQRARQHTN